MNDEEYNECPPTMGGQETLESDLMVQPARLFTELRGVHVNHQSLIISYW